MERIEERRGLCARIAEGLESLSADAARKLAERHPGLAPKDRRARLALRIALLRQAPPVDLPAPPAAPAPAPVEVAEIPPPPSKKAVREHFSAVRLEDAARLLAASSEEEAPEPAPPPARKRPAPAAGLTDMAASLGALLSDDPGD